MCEKIIILRKNCFQGVAYAVEGLVNTAQNSTDDQAILNNVSGSAEDAQKALDDLIAFIKQSPLTSQVDGKIFLQRLFLTCFQNY